MKCTQRNGHACSCQRTKPCRRPNAFHDKVPAVVDGDDHEASSPAIDVALFPIFGDWSCVVAALLFQALLWTSCGSFPRWVKNGKVTAIGFDAPIFLD